MKSNVVLMALLSCLWMVLPSHARQWTDNTGVFTVEAELVEVAGMTVRLKKTDGTIVAVPLGRLSLADRQYLKSLNKKPSRAKQLAPRAAEAAIETAMAQPTQCEFVDTPLSDVLQYLSQRHAIPIVVDRRALDDVGISSDAPITARRRQGDLAKNLDAILDPLDLTWVVRYDVLFVTTKEEAEALCEARVYRLLRPVSFDDLINDITGNIAPQSWDTVGGPGSLSPLPPNVLVVAQVQANHRQIEKHYQGVLKRVRSPVPAVVPGLVGPAVAHALSGSVRLEFIETPLKDVVAFVEDQQGVGITLDVRALEDIGLGDDTPITMDLEGVRFSSALSFMLRQLDLTWTADTTGIRITTPEVAETKIELVHYPINGVVQAGQTDNLIELITSCVAPQTWDQVGGPGSIRVGIRGTLDVRQSFGVHRLLARLLADLRQARVPSA